MDNSPILPDLEHSNAILDSMRGLKRKPVRGGEKSKKDPSSIELSDLRRLLVFGNASTYTEAAYHLGISESHLRRIIRKLNYFVGFELVEKSSDYTSILSAKAKLWLQSFGEFHNSLNKLNECMTNIRAIDKTPCIGLAPCIAFTVALWQYLAERHAETDYTCRAGAELKALNQGEYQAFISLMCIDDEEFKSSLIYEEELFYYHIKGQSLDDNSDTVTLILQYPMTIDDNDGRLFDLPAFPGKDLRIIEVADVCEALQLVSEGKGVYPSPLLNSEIVSSSLTASSFDKRINVSVYLTTSIYTDFSFSSESNKDKDTCSN